MAGRKVSPNLELNRIVDERRAVGESLVHLGFGEARLPVFAPLARQLAAGAAYNAYGPVAGGLPVREAVAGYFTRRRLPTGPDQVLVAPGSKPLLMGLQHVTGGEVYLPKPAWNTYAPQAALAGKRAIGVPIPPESGGIPDPAVLREELRAARTRGATPGMVILTLPDNPTGTIAPARLVREVCALAEEYDLLVVSDEVYRDVIHDPATEFLSPADVVPHRTVVTTGLSKSLALGGWRIGCARFPGNPLGRRLRDDVVAVGSEVWSTLAAPMQEVAEYAFSEPPELRAWLGRAARLHGTVARAVHALLTDAGASCRPPTGAFYVYPDFEPVRDALARRGVTDSPSLFAHLLDEYGIAVLAGHQLGDDEGALRFKAATSLLYGPTREEQQAALDAEDPLRLPHVDSVLTRLAESFAKLTA
ncbi:pyridoxal phosphate-dependent aminotransferase [Streptomyces sp. NPDC088194]|uniref:pyridoxal phosphate-dependent aminotransferase n=1 Tax=Streptomyces sp. NPDC088194 TaxID=3154931 RepID=UPI00345050FB